MTETELPPSLTQLTFHGPLSEARAARLVARLNRNSPRTVLDIGSGWAEPGCLRRRRENAEHQLAPPAADVEHGAGTVPAEPGDKPGGPGLGQRPVKGQLS